MTLSPATLEALQQISTPAVANAVDMLDVRPKVGFTPHAEAQIVCRYPDMGILVGYAATVCVSAQWSQDPSAAIHRHTYWDYLASLPEPRILVIKDLDEPRGQGSFLGEVNGAIHRALGCVAAVTDGGYRDHEELELLKLQVFSPSIVTSAGYMHIVSFGGPVKIGGMEVRSGDLLHMDRHGVLNVPEAVADQIPHTATVIRQRELEVVDLYRSGQLNLESLKRIRPR